LRFSKATDAESFLRKRKAMFFVANLEKEREEKEDTILRLFSEI